MPVPATKPQLEKAQPELVRGLGLYDATMLAIGSMIGSGIFIVSADIARQVKSPSLLVVVWTVTGFITVVGALSYGELAAAMPQAGGQYIYLRESLGPMCAFLYGWSMIAVIQTATIAAVGIAFAKFAGVVLPWFSASLWLWNIGTFGPYHTVFGELGPYSVGLNAQNLLAIASIVFLTWINTRGIRAGALVQNIFTTAKTGALLALIVLGFALGTPAARAANFSGFWRGVSLWSLHPLTGPADTVWVGTLSLIGIAMVGSLFSSNSWDNVSFTAGEIRNPRRNLPRALAVGPIIVSLMYVLTNVSYMNVLPLAGTPHGATALARGIQYAADDRVGTAVAGVIFGAGGAAIMALAIMVSTFGANNGLVLAGARIYYAMSRDGLFFRRASRLNRFHAPSFSLWAQGAWACLLCLSGTYSQLIDFVIFAVMLFYVLTLAGLFILRFRRPEMDRPYRAFGYPVLPALCIAMALFIEMQLLRYKPQYTWPGLIIVFLGVPVYWLWRLKPAVQDGARGSDNAAPRAFL
jgi:APA family basic amino acid/polyamine antiporter